MKRYLMTGMAAMVFCGVFTSCSRDTDLGGSNPQQSIQETYEQAFITHFGTPVATQDWGFGDPTNVRTRSENANANEWADPDKDYGGLLVPPKLTPEQVAVVTAYFQSVKDIPYNDPHWTNYFIQQVYKGHSSPKTGTNPAYNEPYSPEAYMALNGTTELYASDYMDHLAAIDEENNFFDHINNFNHGDCGENNEVLDNGGNANDGPFHSDKIMYMKNSTTKSFGYFNSNGSLYHNEYTGLVSWTVIDDWAKNNYDGYDGCLDDDWNRSYMGFDFEQMIEGQCYAYVQGSEVWDNSKTPAKFVSGTPKYLTISGEYYINGVKQTDYVYQYNNQPVQLLSDQMNRYCGEKITVSDEQLYSDMRDANNNNAYLGKKLNTDFIDGLLADGYLPIDTKQMREWAIVGGCADGYYSDWIVTLTEAKTDNNTTQDDEYEEIRVIAEDLSVDQKTDFDFNDVVFDVRRYTSGTKSGTAEIILRAAGGTLPLYVDGHEVHAAFGITNTQTMINTRANAKGYVGVDNAKPVTIPIANDASKSINQLAYSIRVYVIKKVNKVETECDLTAPHGDVASKLAVGTDYDWCDERQDIDNKYILNDGTSLFKAYVQGELGNDWYVRATKR